MVYKLPGNKAINLLRDIWSLGDGNSNIFYFTPKIGEDEPILTIIFFNWVETTN